jgi:6-phosphogluconate dehydrogenase
VKVALDLAVPVPSIAAALDARILSSLKEERVAAARVLPAPTAPLSTTTPPAP